MNSQVPSGIPAHKSKRLWNPLQPTIHGGRYRIFLYLNFAKPDWKRYTSIWVLQTLPFTPSGGSADQKNTVKSCYVWKFKILESAFCSNANASLFLS